MLACYRRLLAFRHDSAALRRGGMTRPVLGTGDVLGWTREADGELLLVLVSFVGEEREIDLAGIDLAGIDPAGVGRGRSRGGRHWTARVGS